MKLGTKKGWKSLVPIRMGRKSGTQFCMFPKVRSAGQTPGDAPVYLNVYDLTPVNGYMYWAGLGIFHSGIEGIVFLLFLFVLSPPLIDLDKHVNMLSLN